MIELAGHRGIPGPEVSPEQPNERLLAHPRRVVPSLFDGDELAVQEHSARTTRSSVVTVAVTGSCCSSPTTQAAGQAVECGLDDMLAIAWSLPVPTARKLRATCRETFTLRGTRWLPTLPSPPGS